MTLENAQDLTTFALPVFAVLIVAEFMLSVWRKQKAYDWADFAGSMSQLAGNIVMQLMVRGALLSFNFWLYQYRPFTVPIELPFLILLAVVLDFQFYWYHRASHRIRLLWAIHVSHHSSEHMNFGTALRQSWFGPLSRPLFYWPIPLLGFHPLAIAAVGGLLTIYGFWTHTKQVRDIGMLGKVFVSPAHHRVHHGSNELYIDKNYGNFLIIWDRLFGTYQDETETVRYGLVQNIKTYNPFKIATHEFADIIRDVRNLRGRKLSRVLFGPPDIAS